MPSLLERQAQIAALSDALAAARAGAGSVVLVSGPAGIGKTALLAQARRDAGSGGVRVAAASGSEFEQSFAFGLMRQLLEPLVARLSQERQATVLGQAAAPARAVLGPPGEADEASFSVLHGLYWAVLGLAASEPLALLVDDVQWADRQSLRSLLHIARRVDGSPVSLLLALRTGEPGAGDDLLDGLRAVPGLRRVSVEPLSPGAAAALVRRAMPEADDALCRACRHATRGNPFYLGELTRALMLEGRPPAAEAIDQRWPATIADHVLRRIARIGPQAPRLAQAVAVLGGGAACELAGRLAEVADADALARALRRMEVLGAEDRLAFVHPVVAAAVYADIAPGERQRLHLRAARLLREDGARHDRVAAHLLAVQPPLEEWALDALGVAAREARARGAPDAAVGYLRHACDAHATPARLRELGLAEEHSGDPAAVDDLERARSLCTGRGQRAEIALDLARVLETRGREGDATGVLRAALHEYGDGELAVDLEAALVAAAAGAAEAALPEDFERFTRLVADVPEGPAGAIVLGIAAAGAVMAAGAADAAGTLAEQAIARGLLETDHWDAIGSVLWALTLSERYDEAAARTSELHDRAQRCGHARGVALALQAQANRAERIGALAEAESSAQLGLEIADALDLAIGGQSWLVCSLVDTLVQRGELAAAEAALERLGPAPWPTHHGCNAALAARGRLRTAQGRYEEAAVDLLEVGERCARWPGIRFDGPALTHWRSSAALALDRLGDTERARSLADDELRAARISDTPRALGIALRAAGAVRPPADGLPLLHEAVTRLRPSPARLELAHAHAALGAALRRAGQRTAARDELRPALDLARGCGASALAHFAREELAAAGARPRREALSGLEALTTSERRVAELAAEGLTNRELAQTLYLSPKTIEMHLSRVYRKLAIGSRRELAAPLLR